MNLQSACVVLTTILGCQSTGSAALINTATIPNDFKIVNVDAARSAKSEEVDFDDFLAEIESDPKLSAGLKDARKWLGDGLVGNDAIDLRALRLRAGLSQAALAQATNMSQPNISAIESGKRKPEYATAQKLAKALDVEINEIYQAFEQRVGA